MGDLLGRRGTDDWVAVGPEPLPVEEAARWAVRPDCGGVVSFVGTVRDHAEGREGVTGLEYEAYLAHVEPRLEAVVAEARVRWPEIGRVAVLHRIGRLELTEAAVVVVVSAPHRGTAFDAARFTIDAVKATAPIWKRESWDGGASWGTNASPLIDAQAVADSSVETSA